MRLILTVAIVLALASGAQARSTFTADRIDSQTMPVQAVGLLLGLDRGQDDASVTWELSAAAAVVDAFTAVGTAYAGAFSYPAQAPAERTTLGTHAEAVFRSRVQDGDILDFYLAVVPLEAAKPFMVNSDLPPAELVVEPNFVYDSNDNELPSFMAQPERDFWSDHPTRLVLSDDRPSLQWDVEAGKTQWTVRGDFMLYLYQTDFDVVDAQGTTHYRTGYFTDGGVAVAQENYTRAEIEVRGGTMHLSTHERQVQVNLAEASSTPSAAFTMLGATGVLRQGGEEINLVGDVRIEPDDLRMALAPAGGRFDVQLEGTVQQVRLNGQPIAIAPEAVVGDQATPADLGLWPLVGTGLAGAALAAWLLRRRLAAANLPLRLAEAQTLFDLALYDDALRASRAIMRRDAGNLDAVTVATLSLLLSGRPQAAGDVLDRAPHRASSAGLIGVLRALVLQAQQRPAEAERTLEAAFDEDPSLHNETMAVDLLDQLRQRTMGRAAHA